MIRVLVVDDEPLVAEAHAGYLARVPGFELAGIAHTAGEALARATRPDDPIDLILLDLTLPDGDGLEVARRLRAARTAVDVIPITAVRQLDAVEQAMALGAVHYLVKPFDFATFRDRLEHYAEYRRRLDAAQAQPTTASVATQSEIDELLASRRSAARQSLPKGLTLPTLDAVAGALREAAPADASASELAETLAISRITARRYLEHLAETGLALRGQRYGTPGRPEVTYRWR